MNPMLPDQPARDRAAIATDDNIVVTAGAGTGKTTLLIDRLTHILFRPHRRVSLHQIVALTFTNKAASDMKMRLRQRLMVMRDLARGSFSQPDHLRYETTILNDLQSRYGLTDQQVADMAEQMLNEIEQAHIETIHSFAAYVLRLFPVEAGVDPSFQEDDGTQFTAHFYREWTRWLDDELATTGPHRDDWLAMLQLVSLDELQIFARALMEEIVPLSSLATLSMTDALPDVLHTWFHGLIKHARELRVVHPKNLKLETMLDEAILQLEKVTRGLQTEPAEQTSLLKGSIPAKTKTWTDEDYEHARLILNVAQVSQHPIPKPFYAFLSILLPFIEECQQTFLKAGWVSFNGLIAKARDLLRDSPRVRQAIKQQFQAILVDEFQDTDPIQYELILYVAEDVRHEAHAWSQIRLEPGQLFIVGDPKQSIYAFRRADIEAYDSVIHDCVLAQATSQEPLTLRSNFRSHAGILGPVNVCCQQWFPADAIKGVQPGYDHLLPADTQATSLPGEGVQIRLVRSLDETVDADTASRVEAQELARWLTEDVFDQQHLLIKDTSVPIQPRHVAILFRTLTHLRVYVEAFRQYGIPYVTEGEKHFFERQEIVDCIHLLRVLADPYDRVALVGILRSPLGGCSDDKVATLLRGGHFDEWHQKTLSTETPLIFGVFQGLREETAGQPVVDALDRIFQRTPFLELTAASMDGEQAMANVRKLQEMATTLARQSGTNFRSMVNTLTHWMHDPPPEAEPSLVEDEPDALRSSGAMRLMSIHKAKGLEFPMVILAGLHRGADPRRKPIWVDHDWLTDCLGMRLGSYYSLGGIYLETKMTVRQRAEVIRLLYVAMTRAQRRLVLSAGLTTTSAATPRGLLSLIVNAMGLDLESVTSSKQDSIHQALAGGDTAVSLDVVTASQHRTDGRQPNSQPWENVEADECAQDSRWRQRHERMITGSTRLIVTTPTRMGKTESPTTTGNEQEAYDPSRPSAHLSAVHRSRERQALVGTLAHRVLQSWNFQDDPETLPTWIETLCHHGIPDDSQDESQHLLREVQDLFKIFVTTAPYAMLRQAEILGREVPLTVPWRERHVSDTTKNGLPAVLHGVIDVVYRVHNQIWVADYKTTMVNPDSIDWLVANYHSQAIAYREALRDVFNDMPVRAQIIFLRQGSSVEV